MKRQKWRLAAGLAGAALALCLLGAGSPQALQSARAPAALQTVQELDGAAPAPAAEEPAASEAPSSLAPGANLPEPPSVTAFGWVLLALLPVAGLGLLLWRRRINRGGPGGGSR